MTFPFSYLIMYILDAELTEGQRWHRNGLQKQVFSWQTTVRKTVSCQKDFYSKHSLEQSRWLRISCSIKLEIHKSLPFQVVPFAPNIPLLSEPEKALLTEHFCVLNLNIGEKVFARSTYCISHRNQLVGAKYSKESPSSLPVQVFLLIRHEKRQ